jgi:HK97 family phage major capsid protein
MPVLTDVTARLEEVKAEADSLLAQRGALIDLASAEKRGLSEAEEASYAELGANRAASLKQITMLDERVVELKAADVRRSVESAAARPLGGAVVTDPPQYVRDGGTGHSYFRDLAKATTMGDRPSIDRLSRNDKALAETRALGNLNTAGGAGGEFAPPEWLVSDFVALTSAGRVTSQLYSQHPVPAGVSSISIPKITTGTTANLQTTQNSALDSTDLATSSVTTGFSTVGGTQVVSQQLLDQSAINFDAVVNSDLARAYAYQIGNQAINGTGQGANANAIVNGLSSALLAPAGNSQAFTSATPLASEFFHAAAGLLASFTTERFQPPTAWIMHPRRYYWLLSRTDTQNRPLVVPSAVAVNTIATAGSDVATPGATGMTFLGLPVYIDPFITTAGLTTAITGGTQDQVYLIKGDDLWWFESPPQFETFRETNAASLGVLFRVYGYVGAIVNRLYRSGSTGSIGLVYGTGLAAPVFTA